MTYSLTLYPLLHSFRRMAELDKSLVILYPCTATFDVRNIALNVNAPMDFRIKEITNFNIPDCVVTLFSLKI